jgi:hypothetical protein
MKKSKALVVAFLGIFILSAAMVGCSSKQERSGEVIEKSTTTTIETPVSQERRTTTTTTETR